MKLCVDIILAHLHFQNKKTAHQWQAVIPE
jgi:hypothetical protein